MITAKADVLIFQKAELVYQSNSPSSSPARRSGPAPVLVFDFPFLRPCHYDHTIPASRAQAAYKIRSVLMAETEIIEGGKTPDAR
jgi:hypothetical protein